MKERFIRFSKSDKGAFGNQNDQELGRSCAGRIVSALTFIVVIACLAVWITVFLLVKDRISTVPLYGNILTNLTCIIFFGGLVITMFIGALAGNFLKRTFWKAMIGRKKM